MARGQIEGGTVQGVGFATIEQVVMKDGAMLNAQLTNYTIPTTLDTPRMDTIMLDNPYLHGPFGAKGVGEIPMDGPAPAIINALRHAAFGIARRFQTREELTTCSSALGCPAGVSASTRIRWHDCSTCV